MRKRWRAWIDHEIAESGTLNQLARTSGRLGLDGYSRCTTDLREVSNAYILRPVAPMVRLDRNFLPFILTTYVWRDNELTYIRPRLASVGRPLRTLGGSSPHVERSTQSNRDHPTVSGERLKPSSSNCAPCGTTRK